MFKKKYPFEERRKYLRLDSVFPVADFYRQKNDSSRAEAYQNKANYYLNELSKMIISSPSPAGQGDGCLPYATSPAADTGHGWRTPHGNRTGLLPAPPTPSLPRKIIIPWR